MYRYLGRWSLLFYPPSELGLCSCDVTWYKHGDVRSNSLSCSRTEFFIIILIYFIWFYFIYIIFYIFYIFYFLLFVLILISKVDYHLPTSYMKLPRVSWIKTGLTRLLWRDLQCCGLGVEHELEHDQHVDYRHTETGLVEQRRKCLIFLTGCTENPRKVNSVRPGIKKRTVTLKFWGWRDYFTSSSYKNWNSVRSYIIIFLMDPFLHYPNFIEGT